MKAKIKISVIVLILGFISYQVYAWKASVSFKQQKESKIVTNTSRPLEQKKLKILEMLGTSNKFSKKQIEDIEKIERETIKLAKENPEDLLINGQTEEKKVCITFDDGPDATITPKILDILKQNDVKASFFFVGERLRAYQSVVKRTYNEGHLVLGHTFSHPSLIKKDAKTIENEILLTENSLYKIIGKKPQIIRPPYGYINQKVVDVFKKNNCIAVVWSIDTYDWSQREKQHIAKTILDNVRPGDIVLMHSNSDKKATAQALPEIISGLKKMDYKMVTLEEMLGLVAYKN